MIDVYKGINFCNLHTVKCPKENWPLDIKNLYTPKLYSEPINLMPLCCERYIRDVIFYIADLFQEQGIPYWMDFGTLLGAIRYSYISGRLIPYDTDGDLCLFLNDRSKVLSLKNRIERDGFHLVQHNYKSLRKIHIHGNTVLRVCRSEINRNQIDLFFWERNDEYKTLVSDGLNIDKTFPDWFVEKRFPVLLYGKPIMAPRKPEVFLEMRFGPKWRIPQNRKVHGYEAEHCHKFGFTHAKLMGWNKNMKI